MASGSHQVSDDTMASMDDHEAREALVRALFDAAVDAILITDEHEQIVAANAAACELFGRDRDGLIRARLEDLMKDDARAGDAWGESRSVGWSNRVVVVERPDRELRYAECREFSRLGSGRSVWVVRDITAVTLAMRQLRQSQANLIMSQRMAHVGSWELDLSITDDINVNPLIWTDELYRIFGYEPGAVEVTNELFFRHTHPDDRAAIQAAVREALDNGTVYSIEHRIVLSDGRERIVHERAEIVNDPKTGRPLKMIGTAQDITERRSLELQLRQSQKMEAVGRLAGGVAHDFNNLLTIINGYCWMLLAGPQRTDSREIVAQIHEAGERAAALTRQLLAFSRQSVLSPKVVDLNALLRDNERMIRRLVGEDVTVELELAPRPLFVHADPVDLTQVVLNLAVNARDAMPSGGRLRIETRRVGDTPKASILLTVTDTGIGMTPEVAARIFEPFYTTKEVGKGTGLGLATVYGIVQQSAGRIRVETEPGKGSSFAIQFPEHRPSPDMVASDHSLSPARGGTETLLVVEDDPAVRQLVRAVLETRGYNVLEAKDGATALELASRERPSVDLLITDVVMPDMSGRELAAKLAELLSDLRVLYMSGYTNDDVLRRGVLAAEVPFLQKPFSPDDLVSGVRAVLDGRARSGA